MNTIPAHLDGSAFAARESWETEQEAAAEFDRRVAACKLFDRSFSEVRGFYLTHRPGRQHQDARIDRILIPGEELRQRGFTMTIGVEIKKSSCDFGAAVAQAIDYTYCTWNVGNYWMYCERIFLWPFDMPNGPLQSVMLQNGVGSARAGQFRSAVDDSLEFKLERIVIGIGADSTLRDCAGATSGRKMGSR